LANIYHDTSATPFQDDIIRLNTPVYNNQGHEITEISIKTGQVRAYTWPIRTHSSFHSQLIYIPSISLAHHKAVWGEDAEEFKPERWLDPVRILGNLPRLERALHIF
jgi:hypothetical protein